MLREAVSEIIATKGIADLKETARVLQPMEADYGPARFDWTDEQRPIRFERMVEPRQRKALDEALVVDYERRRQEVMADLDPYLYALRLEHDLFQHYGERQGVEDASLLKVERDKSKPNARLLQSLAYETGSLILSRMLTIRFCEDYGLFKVRYISNGGIDVFWQFAEHFDLPMQELMRQTYRHAQGVFRSIFDANLLDWAIARNDPVLSQALERSAFILSRWDFRTVQGDVLSGVYDQYLDVAQRRRLGEVYTRPEVARFMLEASRWSGNDDILDAGKRRQRGRYPHEVWGRRSRCLGGNGGPSSSGRDRPGSLGETGPGKHAFLGIGRVRRVVRAAADHGSAMA